MVCAKISDFVQTFVMKTGIMDEMTKSTVQQLLEYVSTVKTREKVNMSTHVMRLKKPLITFLPLLHRFRTSKRHSAFKPSNITIHLDVNNKLNLSKCETSRNFLYKFHLQNRPVTASFGLSGQTNV